MAPDIPTADEQGFKGFYSSAWFAVMAPPDTPAAIVDKINGAMTAMLNDEDIKKRFLAQGAEAIPSTPVRTREFVEAERVRWQKVVSDAGVTLD
jgi:tripartite-type tricarboxylate transporter receptor subunit TctC